jgi:predicted ATPase/DNA-binding SARP family transcriptional activator
MKSPLWHIELLGGLRAVAAAGRGIEHAAGPVVSRFRTQKAGALLGYLALYKDRRHPREVLIDLLWPGSRPEAGRASLSVALSSLRRQLEPPGWTICAGTVLLADRFSIGLRLGAVTTDVAEFEAALDRSREDGSLLSRSERIAILTRAVDQYGGLLLQGFYENWIAPEQDRLSGLLFDAADRLVVLLVEAGDISRALACARRMVALDPLREEPRQRLMELLLRTGQPEAVLQQYRDLEHLLRDGLNDAPSAATRALLREAEQRRRHGAAVTAPQAGVTTGQSGPALLPNSTVTFLLADALPGGVTDKERARLRDAVRRHGGRVVRQNIAGAFVAAFSAGADALAGAVAAATATKAALRVALHTGDAEYEKGQYRGLTLQQASRILAVLHPGQIVCSETTAGVVHGQTPVQLVDLGVCRLSAVPDAAAALRLFQVNHQDRGEGPGRPFPPLRIEAGEGSSYNLPLALTRFFGRERELTRLDTLLASPETRLVTLTGMGGTGKTRLALEVARRQSEAPTARAVCFAPLADLTNAALLPNALRDALRLPAAAAEVDPLEQVAGALSGRRRPLLVLDNFEHLVEGGTRILEALLGRLPELTCLVTSRRWLDLSFERQFAVSPLPIPPDGRDQSPERLIGNASVQLFLDRAQAVKPDFQVTPANANVLARLCRRLEGIPLALELAAARALMLPPAQMLAQLDASARTGDTGASARFEILTSRKRDLPARSRTLRAALDWSYHLLEPETQRAFTALSVFHGSWTVEAAEAVMGNVVAPGAMGNLLAELRACSLVQEEVTADAAAGGPNRFRMLETLREYASGQLTREERAERERRHALFYLSLAEHAAQAFTARQTDQFRGWLDADRENLHGALDWTIRTQETELGLRLSGALWWFWTMRGHAAEGRERLTQVLALDERAPVRTPERAASRARAQGCAALLALAQHDYAAARSLLEAALETWRARGDWQGVAATLNSLGSAAQAQGELAAARAFFEESLRLWRENDGPRGAAIALNNLAEVWLSQGELTRAQAACVEACVICRENGYRGTRAWSLHIQGRIAQAHGDPAAARKLLEEGLVLRRAAGAKPGIAESLFSLGQLAHDQGDLAAARARFSESLALRREMNDLRGIAACLEELTRLASAHRTKRRTPSGLPSSLPDQTRDQT